MNRTFTILLAGGSGLLLGWAVSSNIQPRPPENAPSVADTPAAPRPLTGGQATTVRHDFAALKKVMRSGVFLPPDALRAIERMSTDELRSLLTEPWPDENERLSVTREATKEAAAREMFHRDAEGSLKWAEELGPAGREVLQQLVKIAAREEPLFAKPLIDRLGKELGDMWVRSMASSAMEGAVSRGADAVLEVEKIFGPGMFGMPSSKSLEFDKDFDFARLVADSQLGGMRTSALKAWAGIDREAAFQAAMAKLSSDGQKAQGLPGFAYSGVAAASGEPEAAAWFASKLDEFPPDVRARVIGTLSYAETPSEERVQELMKALPTDHDRIEFIAGHYSPFSNQESISEGIKSLESQELQVEALVTTAGRYRLLMERNPSQGATVKTRFEEMMQSLAIPEEGKERIRAAYTP